MEQFCDLKKSVIYKRLFFSTLYISSIAFGGGLVIIELLRKRFVEEYCWISEEDMVDIISIAQSTPGAIAGNAAMLIGYRLVGVTGALLSLLATILPPLVFIIVLSVTYSYFRDNLAVSYLLKGMQAGVAAVVLNLVIKMGEDVTKSKNIVTIFILAAAFVASFVFNFSVPWIILLAAVVGMTMSYYRIIKAKKEEK